MPSTAAAPEAQAGEPSAAPASLGGRVRRAPQVFTFSQAPLEEAEAFSPPAGCGAKLRDIAFVSDNVAALSKKDGETLKALYNVMYGRRFQLRNLKVIKEQLLDFSGVVEQDEKSRATLFAKIAKWKRSFVQEVMDMLGVDRSKKSFEDQDKAFDKDSLINRLIDWLYNPQPTAISEKKAAAAVKAEAKKERQKAQRAKKAAAKTKGTKRKSSPTATSAKKKRKTKVSADDEEDEDEDMNEDTESEGEDSGSDFEEDTKKSKKSPHASKAGARRAKRSRTVEDDDDEEDEYDENDVKNNQGEGGEPAAGDKSKSADPEGDSSSALSSELQEKVKDIIAHGNAEELTVKKIVRQLSADLGRDVSDQKKAIKDFITDGQAL